MKYKHGFSKGKRHPLYRKWQSIKNRCYNPNNSNYKYYGGRGIKICKEWVDNPTEFIIWAFVNGWKPELEIDRIDNDGDYSPENCQFVTHSVNTVKKRLLSKNNTSGYRGVTKLGKKWRARITINGKRKSLGLFDEPVFAALEYDYHAYVLNDGRPMNFISKMAV